MSRRHKRIPGVSLAEQREDFDSQSLCIKEDDPAVSNGLDLSRLEKLLDFVRKAPDLLQLQKKLTIWNKNEFMVTDSANPEAFEGILMVQNRWSSSFVLVAKASEKKKEKYKNLLEEVISQARHRFKVLYNKKNNRLTKR